MAGRVLQLGGRHRGVAQQEQQERLSWIASVLKQLKQAGVHLTLPKKLPNLDRAKQIYHRLKSLDPHNEATLIYVGQLIGSTGSVSSYHALVSGLGRLLNWRETLQKAEKAKSLPPKQDAPPGLKVRLPDGTVQESRVPRTERNAAVPDKKKIPQVQASEGPPERVIYIDPDISSQLQSGKSSTFSFEMNGLGYRLPRNVVLRMWRKKMNDEGWHCLCLRGEFLVLGSRLGSLAPYRIGTSKKPRR